MGRYEGEAIELILYRCVMLYGSAVTYGYRIRRGMCARATRGGALSLERSVLEIVTSSPHSLSQADTANT